MWGCIVPWNYPLLLLAWKVAPALAAGNTVVAKPSELTPLSTLMLASCFEHLPPGAFNVVAGAGDVGEAIVRDPRVDGVAFTGSVATGKRVAGGVRGARGAREPRDGRQGPVHRVRRRGRPGGGGRQGRRLGRVPERRPGVHLGRALLRGARALRRLRGRVRGARPLAARGRPARRRDRRGADGVGGPAREGRGAGRGRRGRRSVAGGRRRPRRAGARPLLLPRRGHRRARRDGPAARGDLRAGRADRAGGLARRGDRAGQRHPLRARRQRLHPRPRDRAPLRARDQVGHGLGQRPADRQRRRARSAG